MKKLYRYFFYILVLILFVTIPVFSQWTICPGFGSLTGLGFSPSVSVSSPTVVWIAGGTTNSPKVMRTTDGGNTFVNVTGNMTATPELWCVWGADQNTAYVGDGGSGGGSGGNAKVWKTTNGGVTWSVIFTTGGSTGFMNDIVFSRTSPNAGYMESDPTSGLGGPFWVQKTTDGGSTWTLLSAPGAPGEATAQNCMAVIDDQLVAFGLGSSPPARIRYTTNGGITWNLASISGIQGGFVSGLAVRSDKQVWICGTGDNAGGSLPNIGRSTDGGVTWSVVNTGGGITGYCTMKWVYSTNVCFLMGSNGIGRSTDAGLTWTSETIPNVSLLMNFDVYFSSSTVYGYAIASDGTCIKTTESLTGFDPGNISVPSKYELDQNYPNPFNPATTIKYSLPKASQVTLKIYDVLGNEVKTMVDKYQSAGNYVESFDGSELASGVYFYSLRAGDYSETKRMSLVK
jgi:photosystem II stability/assembly factor-like uncharacterized protein